MFDFLKQKMPSDVWFRDNVVIPKYTPDLWQLEQTRHQLIFEYGELMNGFPKHSNLLDNQWLGPAYTVERFALLKKNQGKETFPIALKARACEPSIARAKVGGELYKVSSNHIRNLDNYRENGISFVRKRVTLLLTTLDKFGDPLQVRAWMYVGNVKHWTPAISWDQDFYRGRGGSAFSQVKRYPDNRPWLGNYYYFSKNEFSKADLKCFLHLKNGNAQQQDNPK